MRYFILIFTLLFFSCNTSTTKKKVEISENSLEIIQQEPSTSKSEIIIFSKDSLPITADIYEVNNKKPTILLCHQAGFSRGEYKDTAVKLMALGFSSMAIDQRSGNKANDIINETAKEAKSRNLPTNYLDAKQDIEAAIDYLYDINGNQPIILVGSSYSATLVLLIGENSKKVKAVAAFSPGEYYKKIDVKNTIKNYKKPVFVTSSKKETENLEVLVSLINTSYLTHFKPSTKGIHGSRALWNSTEGNEMYWDSFQLFLSENSVN
jgi:dienelactone hydrolase